MESITCIIPTFRRPKLLRRTVELLQTNLKYAGEVYYYISTDAPGDGSFEILQGLSHVHYWTNPQAGNMGRNLNYLLSKVVTPLILQLDDDMWLVKPLDVTKHAQKLLNDATAGVVRLMWLGGHRYTAVLEADQSVNHAYWRVSWKSNEPYLASNRAHLKHTRWHERMGKFPEGLPIGATEEAFCMQASHRAAAGAGVDILIPLDTLTESSWEHAGAVDSWREKGL